MAEWGYARVSTLDQNPQLQLDALTAAGIDAAHVRVDRITGTTQDRPGWVEILAGVQRGDRLTVWKLDRAGRSVAHLVQLVNDLDGRGVQFRSITDAIDTSTPSGRLTFHVFASIAEFEHDLIVERTQAGLTAARARGVATGRKSPISAAQAALIEELADRGQSHAAISALVGVSRAAVGRVLRAEIGSLAGTRQASEKSRG